MFKRIKDLHKYPQIHLRLISGLTILLAVLILIGLFYYRDIRQLNATIENLRRHPYTVSNSVRNIKISINGMHRSMKDVALAKNKKQLDDAITIVNNYEEKAYEEFEIVFERFLGDPEDVKETYYAFKRWRIIRDEVIELVRKGKIEEAAEITKGKGAKHVELLLTKAKKMVDFADKKADEYNINAIQISKSAQTRTFVLIALIFVIGILVFIWLMSGINYPLRKLVVKIDEHASEKFKRSKDRRKGSTLGMLDYAVSHLADYKEILEKKVEEKTMELVKSNQLIENAINNSPSSIVIVNLDGSFKSANDAFCNLIGYSTEELVNMKFNDITIDEDKEVGVNFIKKALSRGNLKANFEKRYQSKLGSIIHASVTTVLVKNEENEPEYFFTQISDLTEQKQKQKEIVEANKAYKDLLKELSIEIDERKKAELMIKESEERLLLAIKAANQGLFDLDLQTGNAIVNKQYAEMLGYVHEDFVETNQKWAERLHDEDREQVFKTYKDYIEGIAKEYKVEFRQRTSSGVYKWILSTGEIVEYDNEGMPVRMLGIHTDIDDLKSAQLKVLELQKKEKNRIEEELRKIKESLVRTTRLAAIGQVSASIAHDLRNPLGAVRNANFFLQRKLKVTDEKLTKHFQIIDSEIDTADMIISNLLQLARAKEPEKLQVDIEEIISEAHGRYSHDDNVEIFTSYENEPFFLYCDKPQMVQVFNNLFENAIQAKKGKIDIFIEAYRQHMNNFITFKDNGPGIDDEVQKTLFEPLITTKAKGTGLGLTICKQIIEKHSGTIEYIAKEKGGACFQIKLPVK